MALVVELRRCLAVLRLVAVPSRAHPRFQRIKSSAPVARALPLLCSVLLCSAIIICAVVPVRPATLCAHTSRTRARTASATSSLTHPSSPTSLPPATTPAAALRFSNQPRHARLHSCISTSPAALGKGHGASDQASGVVVVSLDRFMCDASARPAPPGEFQPSCLHTLQHTPARCPACRERLVLRSFSPWPSPLPQPPPLLTPSSMYSSTSTTDTSV